MPISKRRLEKFAYPSATLHLYENRLWSNYGHGKKKSRFPGGRRQAFRHKELKERAIMSNNNNQINIPQAREAMDKFKMQAAQDKGVPSTY